MSDLIEGQFFSFENSLKKFDDPFILYSDAYFPDSMSSALELCRYLWFLLPRYRRASQRVARHFITEFDFPGAGDSKEKDDFKHFIEFQLGLKQILNEMGDEERCFQSDVKVPTKKGVFKISDLKNQTVDVIAGDSYFRKAKFKEHGQQNLKKIVFKTGETVEATANHEWFVLDNLNNQLKTTTNSLQQGYKIRRTVALEKPEKDLNYYEAINSFASLEQNRSIDFYELFQKNDSVSYLYGFFCKYLELNADIYSEFNKLILYNSEYKNLECLKSHLPRIGIFSESIREAKDQNLFELEINLNQIDLEDIYSVSLREKYLRAQELYDDSYIYVDYVEDTGKKETVYCCVEPQTHAFVIENGILTSNCFGNAFYRIHFPFDRFLIDRRNGEYARYKLSDFPEKDIHYNYKELKYEIPDPKNYKRRKNSDKNDLVKLDFIDIPSKDKSSIKLRKLDPRNVAIKYSTISGKSQIIYRFEDFLVKDIQADNLLQINNMPKDMLSAIAEDKDFLFNHDEVFHLKAPMISGISYYGWALPEPIANFRSIHQFQVYRKADEAVGMDYVLPFRVISPEASGNVSDVMNNVVMSKWTSNVESMIKRRRQDKTSIHALPFPVAYQEFSGGTKQYTQKEMMEYHSDELLDAAGYPVELFKGSLQIQQVPTAIRLFENQFWHIYDGYNAFVQWVADKVSAYLETEKMTLKLQKPSIADNIDKQNVLLQLGSQGEIPRKSYMNYFGISNPEDAAVERMEEDLRIEKAKQKKQVEFEKTMQNSINAQAAGGGQEAAQSEQGGTTPQDIEEEAMQKAEEWLSMPEGERRKAMDATRVQNFNLYSMAYQFMDKIRSEGASKGRQQVNQQYQQGG